MASAQFDQSSLCAQWVAKDPSFLHADSEDSDQTGRMPRLIWVFAGRTCHVVGFVMRRFNFHIILQADSHGGVQHLGELNFVCKEGRYNYKQICDKPFPTVLKQCMWCISHQLAERTFHSHFSHGTEWGIDRQPHLGDGVLVAVLASKHPLYIPISCIILKNTQKKYIHNHFEIHFMLTFYG